MKGPEKAALILLIIFTAAIFGCLFGASVIQNDGDVTMVTSI